MMTYRPDLNMRQFLLKPKPDPNLGIYVKKIGDRDRHVDIYYPELNVYVYIWTLFKGVDITFYQKSENSCEYRFRDANVDIIYRILTKLSPSSTVSYSLAVQLGLMGTVAHHCEWD